MAKAFFDQKLLLKAAKNVTGETLNRVGSYTRKVAMNSMKRAPKTNKPLDEKQIAVKGQHGRVASRPGNPPYSHKGNLKDSIRFAVEQDEQIVTIGPKQYKGRSEGARVLERGGTISKKTKINAPKPKGSPKKPAQGRVRPKGFRYFYSEEARQKAITGHGKGADRNFAAWCRAQEIARRNIIIKIEQIKVKKRPYMDPAFAEAKQRLPELFEEAKMKMKSKNYSKHPLVRYAQKRGRES